MAIKAQSGKQRSKRVRKGEASGRLVSKLATRQQLGKRVAEISSFNMHSNLQNTVHVMVSNI